MKNHNDFDIAKNWFKQRRNKIQNIERGYICNNLFNYLMNIGATLLSIYETLDYQQNFMKQWLPATDTNGYNCV